MTLPISGLPPSNTQVGERGMAGAHTMCVPHGTVWSLLRLLCCTDFTCLPQIGTASIFITYTKMLYITMEFNCNYLLR